jgi:hypothetical protein
MTKYHNMHCAVASFICSTGTSAVPTLGKNFGAAAATTILFYSKRKFVKAIKVFNLLVFLSQ